MQATDSLDDLRQLADCIAMPPTFSPSRTLTTLIFVIFVTTNATIALARSLTDGVAEKALKGLANGLVLGFLVMAYFIVVWAVRSFRTKVLQPLNEARIARSLPDLVLAAATGDNQTVAMLLTSGVDPKCAGPEGQTALVLAARNGHQATVHLLLANGANPLLKTKAGNTAADTAIRFGHTNLANLLVAAAFNKQPTPSTLLFFKKHSVND